MLSLTWDLSLTLSYPTKHHCLVLSIILALTQPGNPNLSHQYPVQDNMHESHTPNHIPNARQPCLASDYHVGKCRCRMSPSLQKVCHLALTYRVHTHMHVCMLAWEGSSHTVDSESLREDQRIESSIAPEQGSETIR